jgi:hypothetical protein
VLAEGRDRRLVSELRQHAAVHQGAREIISNRLVLRQIDGALSGDDGRELRVRQATAPVVLRLMMACNDFAIANDAFGQWREEQSPSRQDRQQSALMYFLRLQIAHVYEGLHIIKHINSTPKLAEAVRRCDARTQRSYDRLVTYLKSSEFDVMELIRDKITFHYTPTLASKALAAISAKHPNQLTTVRMGEKALDWYFEAADRIIDRVVVREIFKVPLDADVSAEVDKIVRQLQEIANVFGDFAGYFIQHHAGR